MLIQSGPGNATLFFVRCVGSRCLVRPTTMSSEVERDAFEFWNERSA